VGSFTPQEGSSSFSTNARSFSLFVIHKTRSAPAGWASSCTGRYNKYLLGSVGYLWHKYLNECFITLLGFLTDKLLMLKIKIKKMMDGDEHEHILTINGLVLQTQPTHDLL
jgi:hypothetical protein